MLYKENISKSVRFVILLGCSCGIIYLTLLLVSYFYAIIRVEQHFEEQTFPKMTEMIDERINLFFNPSIKGLTLLAENLDWPNIMQKALSNHGQIKSRMKAWAAELEADSIGISDRDRSIVWDYWSDKPITLDPGLSRDKWFFDFWERKKIPDWTFTLYTEHPADDYHLYMDRVIRDRSGRPIGSIAAKIPLVRLKEELMKIIGRNERVIILDDKANVIIDISRKEAGEDIQIFTLEDSSVKEKNSEKSDPIITAILSRGYDYGNLETDNKKIYYKRTSLLNGAISILSIIDINIHLQRETSRLKHELIILFTSFTLFLAILFIAMMFYTQRVKSLASKLEFEKSKFEDLLFIITHGFGNEILLIRKNIEGMPRRFIAGIDLRLSDMSLLIQNSVNAARIGSSKSLIISKPYSFSWQWEKLTDKFAQLSTGKGQTFYASPAVDCVIDNDEEMVYQILANLVSNAVKYAPINGKVSLNVRLEKDTLLITVSDSGPGFLPKDEAEMFLKFKKLTARPTGGERSTGLGLYIVKQLADACDIRLTLSKGEGELCGAVWEIELRTVQSCV